MKILIYGSVNIDYSYLVKDIVKPGETIHCTFADKAPGGKGANQAYAAGKAARGRYDVFFAGKSDHEADFIYDKMKSVGISCEFVTYSDYGTGKAIIQVSETGQNSIMVCGNGNIHVERCEIDNVLANFSQGDCVILNAEINNLEYLIDKCFEKSMTIFFNPSPISDNLKTLPLDKVSYLIFNEIEGACFAGLDQKSEYIDILNALIKKYPNSKIVLTMGSEGAYGADSTGTVFVPATKVQAIDTTACGDTFLGFFAVETISGQTVKDALTVASKAAGIAASRNGAMNSIPDYNEVM